MKTNLKNFALLISGQAISLFGNAVLDFALAMYILEVTGSAAIFASVLAAAAIPTILLTPLGGILADRANRRNIMVALDLLSGISIVLAALFFNNENSIAVINVLLIILSVLGAFETPTVQACVPQMFSGDDLIKRNAVVNQISAVSYLAAPILGGILYPAIGIKPVIYITMICFFLTAVIECFIKLEHQKPTVKEKITHIIKNDFIESMQFIGKEHPKILKMLLSSTLLNFFAAGAALVGLPFIIRNILGMSAEMYGFAQGLLAFSAILGSILAGMLTQKLKMKKLYIIIITVGICFILSGTIFLIPFKAMAQYILTVIGFSFLQITVCIFSIFALSYIQEKTPNHLTGKVMSYVTTISLCAQPFSQTFYGALFDKFNGSIYFVLIPTGLIIVIFGIFLTRFFKKIDS